VADDPAAIGIVGVRRKGHQRDCGGRGLPDALNKVGLVFLTKGTVYDIANDCDIFWSFVTNGDQEDPPWRHPARTASRSMSAVHAVTWACVTGSGDANGPIGYRSSWVAVFVTGVARSCITPPGCLLAYTIG